MLYNDINKLEVREKSFVLFYWIRLNKFELFFMYIIIFLERIEEVMQFNIMILWIKIRFKNNNKGMKEMLRILVGDRVRGKIQMF